MTYPKERFRCAAVLFICPKRSFAYPLLGTSPCFQISLSNRVSLGCYLTFLFCCVVESVGEVTVHFVLVHGKSSDCRLLSTLIRREGPKRVPYFYVSQLIERVKDDFLNWVVFNLNFTTMSGCKGHMFERTLVAQRRGLSRDGREFLASQGFLMKRTLYDDTLKKYLRAMTRAQRYHYSTETLLLLIPRFVFFWFFYITSRFLVVFLF